MSAPIQKFVERLQGLESRGARDLSMSIQEAKSLHAEMTRLLLELNEYKTKELANKSGEEIIKVEIVGGKF